tara:strand:+ start:556 stop:882 length:327 start_codon:yes stop_codon:yes gene_type:complete
MGQNYDNTTYIENGDATGDVTGPTIEVREMKTISFICVNAGSTPAGVYKIQASNDDTTWVVTATTSTISADATTLLNITDFGSKYVRLFYDRSSGGSATGLDVSVNAC